MGVAIRVLLSSKDKKTGWRDEAEITPCTRKTHQTTRKTLRRCRSASNEALLSVLQLERQIFKAWKQQGEICETVQSVSPWQLIWGFWPAGRQATPIVRNLGARTRPLWPYSLRILVLFSLARLFIDIMLPVSGLYFNSRPKSLQSKKSSLV